MDFMKKLKIRLWLAITYIIVGAALFAICIFVKENSFLSTFGFAFVVMGLVRLRNYLIITRNEESVKKQRIAETDERNIAIASRAKSLAFTIFIEAAAVSVVICHILNMTNIATIISYTICALAIIYWLCYFIIRKNS